MGLLACSGDEPAAVFEPPPRPTPIDQGFPVDDQGRAVLGTAAGVTLAWDPAERNPVRTVSDCSWWLMRCYDQQRDMDRCYRAAPRCTSETPWLQDAPCCPTACADDYAARRRAGVAPLPAMRDTAREGSCFPGLAAYVNGGGQ